MINVFIHVYIQTCRGNIIRFAHDIPKYFAQDALNHLFVAQLDFLFIISHNILHQAEYFIRNSIIIPTFKCTAKKHSTLASFKRSWYSFRSSYMTSRLDDHYLLEEYATCPFKRPAAVLHSPPPNFYQQLLPFGLSRFSPSKNPQIRNSIRTSASIRMWRSETHVP